VSGTAKQPGTALAQALKTIDQPGKMVHQAAEMTDQA